MPKQPSRRVGAPGSGRRILVFWMVFALALLVAAGRARAATLTVTTTADSYASPAPLSLRAAIIAANSATNPGPDTIILPAGHYTLSLPGAGEDAAETGDLDITDDLTIVGAGAAATTIDATGLGDRVFQVIRGHVQIRGVTLKGGRPPEGTGGGILNFGNLELTDCVIADNDAANAGAGISNQNFSNHGTNYFGSLKLTRCVFQGNGQVVPPNTGGALYSVNALTIADCTFTNNLGRAGGALYAAGTSDVRRSLFAGNTATPNGGGAILVPVGGRLNLTDCTLAANTSTSDGGGGALATTTNLAAPQPNASVLNCTFADNVAPNTASGATVAIISGSVTLENTIVRQSGAIAAFNVPPASRGHNLTSDASGPSDGPGDRLNTDPQLGSLQDNGGPTATLAPQPGSPAIDAGASADAPFTDQRGYPCWVGAAADIGAVETQTPFWVTNVNDAGPGSLRQAILAVNSANGDDSSILFDIPGTGPFRIQPQSALPALTHPAVVDGYSQPGASPNTLTFGDNATPQIVLDGGALAPSSAAGVLLNADRSAVRGLVIQGQFQAGVQVNASQTRLEGNFIGTDGTGKLSQPNNQGIALAPTSRAAVIGGVTPATRNLVSGNTGAGIYLSLGTGNQILGNYIGADATGLAALGNGDAGIRFDNASTNTVGGTNASARNLILGNHGAGISLSGADNAVWGNTIVSNTAAGVAVLTAPGPATGNVIAGNSIYGNGTLGIDLGGTGATLANDPGDADAGPNNLQNYPVLVRASPVGGGLQIQYSVPTDPANASYPLTIEFFLADSRGQGMTPLGKAMYPALLAGLPATAVVTATLSDTQQLVATATDAAGNTSELSPPVPVNQPPTINLAFEPPAGFAHTATGPQTVVARDLDGDGYADVVLNDPGSSNVWVWPNTSVGHGNPADWLGTPLKFVTGISPAAVAVADLDGDGKPDLVTVSEAGGLSVLLNASSPGTLAFNTPATVVAGLSGHHLAIADLDGDGKPDVVVVGGGTLTLLRNHSSAGAITFSAPVVISTAADAEFVALADLDGDGRTDIVTANPGDASVSLFRNGTTGPGDFTPAAFGSRTDLLLGASPTSIAIGDFDRDGKPDLAVSLRDAASVAVLRNTASSGTLGATSFAPPLVFPTGLQPLVVAIADLDGDGKPDLATADGSGPTVTTLRNASSPGQINFQPLGQFAAQPNPVALAAGDLNRDGRPDLVLSQLPPTSGNGTLSVLANNPAVVPLPLSGSPVPLTIPFAIGDAETPADQLSISVSSSNPDLIPPGSVQVQTTGDGSRNLIITPAANAAGDAELTVTVTDASGGTAANMIRLSVGCGDNTSWPNACPLELTAVQPNVIGATIAESLDDPDQSRWFRFAVQPGSQVIVTLTDLPANYDLFLFNDIYAAYLQLATPTADDLVKLGAEYAPAAFSPAAFSGDAYSPAAFSPAAFSPAAFSPAAFSPAAFSPAAFSPAAFSPAAFSPAAFSPAAFSPAAFSPAAFSPAAFSSASVSPAAFSPAAFSGAQTRSLIGVSAFDGTTGEGIVLNTWDNSGDFYVCVRGRNGAFAPGQSFRLDVVQNLGDCGGLTPLPASTTTPVAGGYQTIILTDPSRMNPAGDPTLAADIAQMQTKLLAFAARPEVQGVIVDVGADAAVREANRQADANLGCVTAKNRVADAIHGIITAFRQANPTLRYVVIVGNDGIIPFYRYPDTAGLANEKNYIPPVFDSSASQASLRLGQVLTQDAYGSVCDLSIHGSEFPVPDLAVGRLVETPAEISGMLDAYAGMPGGVLPTPTASLVTGYDFMTGTANAIEAALVQGMGNDTGTRHDTLIAPADLSPQADPTLTANWTAAELLNLLTNHAYNITFLAGHYNAGAALAADWVSELSAADLDAAPVDMTGGLVYGAGCHVGYNLVDQDSIPGVTQSPDWAQVFARKHVGAFIGGTGYQYGDTEFIEYSDRLYLEFTKQLLRGSGPVPLGPALVAAKRKYLADTPEPRGIHEKALLEATFFGFPMLSLNLPDGRGTPPPSSSIVTELNPFAMLPGAPEADGGLGLHYADVDIATQPLTENSLTLKVYPEPVPPAPDSVVATYLTGRDGQVTAPGEPVMPLVSEDVTVADDVLRGVGFLEGDYTDETGVRALIGAPATEIRGVFAPAQSDFLVPLQPWGVNYFDALCGPVAGTTRLNLFPAQYVSSAPGSDVGTRRAFSRMKLRLYYSTNTTVYTDSTTGLPITPALAAAPVISAVTGLATGNSVAVQTEVVGDPSAGIQEVWVTYTATHGAWAGAWRSLYLTQRTDNTAVWQGTLTLPADGTQPGDVRFMVQAANGVGLVTLDTRYGGFYTPTDPAAPPAAATTLTLDAFPLSGRYGDTPALSAVLAGANGPVSGQTVVFGIGMQRLAATTDANGRATVNFPLLGVPNTYVLQAAFGGTSALATASATAQFVIQAAQTKLTLENLTTVEPALNVVGTLTDGNGAPLGEKTIFFLITDAANNVLSAKPVITDYAGRAALGRLPVTAGAYTVKAAFNETIPLPPGMSVAQLVLQDERYESADAADQYAFALVAADQTIQRRPGRGFRVAISTIVANTQGLAGPPPQLVSVDATSAQGASVVVDSLADAIVYSPPPFDYPDSFHYTISDGLGNTATGLIYVTILPDGSDTSPTSNIISLVAGPGGMVTVTFIGLPTVNYRVQATDSLAPPVVWTTLATMQAGVNGQFSYTDADAPSHPSRFYRSVSP